MKIQKKCAIGIAALVFANAANATLFNEIGSIASPTMARQLIYSDTYNTLIQKNTASAIFTMDLGTTTSALHLANWRFTDMSASPDGRYVFAADYGGENIGYGTPWNTSYVHRLDLSNNTWETKTAYIAGNIEAVSGDQFILKSNDQWVTYTNNSWGQGSEVTILNTSNGYWTPGYYSGTYSGDISYDPNTGRLLHGNSGLSSQEITAFKLVNNNFYQQESSGTYGTAQGFGGTVTLATDSSALYYGSLQVDPLDVSHNLRVFPEQIYAATGDFAFGNGNYYDAHTGQLLGNLGFSTTVYGLGASGKDFWAYDSSQNMLRHFSVSPVPEAETYILMLAGLGLVGLKIKRRRSNA